MAAASSGDPGGSLNRRLPRYLDPTNGFGELTFLQLTGKNDAPLPKNPFIVGKSVEQAAGGQIEGAVTEAQGTRYTLRVRNPTQVAKLLKMSTLIDGTEVVVQAHPNLNVSRCVISCFDLIQMEEKDILSGLTDQGVIFVKRITRLENGNRINTSAIILTFNKCVYPSHVKVGLLRTNTRPYYPNPMLCYGCFKYGHPRARCPGPQRCFNCSGEHQTDECEEAAHCLNCDGNHRPNSRQCPVYKKETEIIRVKIDNNLTYPEARKRANEMRGNYAEVAAQRNTNQLKIVALEKKMQEKDAQITQLQEGLKQKDEHIQKLMTYIHKMRAPIDQTNQDIPQKTQHQSGSHPKAQQGKQQVQHTTGPTLRSRTNSPAVQESKRGRSAKQNLTALNKSEISPDRQSPPLKKIAPTPNDPQMNYSDDDIEVSEVSPS